MIVLSKRLKAIAAMIPPEISVIDIGCDHAYLDIYLTQNHFNTCIATDRNPNVLEITKKNIEAFHLTEQIPVIQSNGFSNLTILKPSIAVIAGMGAHTILQILSNTKQYQLDFIIVQPNNELEYFRKQLFSRKLKIVEEKIVNEKEKYYIIMKLKKGQSFYSKKKAFLGPYLLANKVENRENYYQYLKQQQQLILKLLPKYDIQKRQNCKRKIKWIQKELNPKSR